MGRRKTGQSERDILRELAEERRSTLPKYYEERNRKIEKMIRLGCSYKDIGRRYGLTEKGVQRLVTDGRVIGIKDCFDGTLDADRACFYDPAQ